MKRDMDLIRMLLMQQEDDEKPPGLDQYPGNVQAYHAGLLIDAGLVEGSIAEGGGGEIIGAVRVKTARQRLGGMRLLPSTIRHPHTSNMAFLMAPGPPSSLAQSS